MMTAKQYLLDIGFDDAHLPELFNDDDKSHYKIAELLESYHQAKVKNLGLFSVSKRFEIDFDGNVLAGIEITNNEPKVFGAMNGWGNGISPDKCKITEKTD